MDIKAAAEFLNISVRSVERFVKAKKIAVTYIEGKRDFNEDELTRFKEQTIEPLYHPAIVTDNDRFLSQPVAPEYLGEGLGYMEALASSVNGIAQHYELEAIRSKMVLTLSEAAMVSGLSKGFLSYHLNTCNLSGKKIGRGWKIRPSDLQDFVNALFNGLYESNQV
jgi:hypothetical protein